MRRLILEKGPDLRRRILLVTIAGVPVIFVRMVNDPINVPKLALIFLGVSLVAAIRAIELLQGASANSLKRAWFPAAAVVVPLLAAWIASPYKGWALFGLYDRFQGLVPYLAVAVMAILVADAFTGKIEQVAWALVISGSVVGFYAVVQVLGLDPLTWARAEEAASDAGSTIGNPNFTGGFLAMTLPLSVGLWQFQPGNRRTVAILSVLSLSGWVVTFSQGAWAAGGAGVLLTFGVLMANRVPRARVAATVAVFLVAGLVAGQVLFGAIRGPGPFVPGTVLLRAEAWKGAAAMASEDLLLGRGPNAYAIEGAHHRTQADALRLGYDYPNDPHSVFLAMLTSAGVVGAIGFLCLLGWILRRSVRIRDGDILGAAILGAIAAYLVQSLVSIDELSLRFTFWALVGVLGSLTVLEQEPVESSNASVRRKRRNRIRKKEPMKYPIAVTAISLGALVSVWLTGRFFIADAYALQGVVHALRGEVKDAQSDLDRALDLRNEVEYRRLYGLRIGAAALQSPESGGSVVEPVKEAFMFLDGLPNVSMLAERARILQAVAVFDDSSLDDSLEVWEQAHRLDPFNPRIGVEMAGVLLQLERSEDARKILEPYADDVGDRFAEYWGALALVRAQAGEERIARDALDRGLALDPQDPWVREASLLIEGEES